jgi:hypothetical protein
MTPDRAQAYGRVIAVLGNVAPTKLQPIELSILRFAADELVLAADPLPESASLALRDAYDVLDHLVECGRWTRDGAGRLGQHIEDCAGAAGAIA